MISKEIMQFLRDLEANNNREWFNENKPTFKEHESVVKDVFAFVESQLNVDDQIEKHRLMRIYRDVRFSKDKTPFRARFGGGFTRAGVTRRGGYFLNIEPGGKSGAGGGFWGPEKDDLLRIRKEFEMSDEQIRSIIEDPKFKGMFGEMIGEGVKTAPKGFDKNHPAIDLIKRKQFIFFRHFTDEEVTNENFIQEVMNTFTTIRPFFDYMSEVLTTNLDGEKLV